MYVRMGLSGAIMKENKMFIEISVDFQYPAEIIDLTKMIG